MSDCIFCKIVAGDIPADKVYEDDDLLAFRDIKPAAPVHILVIPKAHIPTMLDLTPDHAALMGKLTTVAARLAREQGCSDGFRSIINTGRVGGQEVYHLHLHILGGAEVLPPMLKH